MLVCTYIYAFFYDKRKMQRKLHQNVIRTTTTNNKTATATALEKEINEIKFVFSFGIAEEIKKSSKYMIKMNICREFMGN